MRKLSIILLIIVSSCSVLRKGSNDIGFKESNESGIDILERIRRQNISNQNFSISKAEIEIRSGEEKQSFIASVRFLFPDKYLISLRSKSGIEGARVFMTGDTLLINDRINRKLYYGKPDYIRKKFGFPSECLPFVLGDFILRDLSESDNTGCINGILDLNGSVSGLRFESKAECRKAKLISVKEFDDKNMELIRIDYGKYYSVGDLLVPMNINLSSNDYKISINVKRIEIPWEGNLNFIPGNEYEEIPLK